MLERERACKESFKGYDSLSRTARWEKNLRKVRAPMSHSACTTPFRCSSTGSAEASGLWDP